MAALTGCQFPRVQISPENNRRRCLKTLLPLTPGDGGRRARVCIRRYGVRSSLQLDVEKIVVPSDRLSSEQRFGFDAACEAEVREKGISGLRRTKLVCTIGPACCAAEQLERLAAGGMNVARLNMCHNSREWHRNVIKTVKKLNREKGFRVSVMIDTEGSQVHMVDYGSDASVKAEEGSVWLFTNQNFQGSRPFTVKANHEGFSKGIKVGDELVLEGGMASFEVVERIEDDLCCKCTDSGLLLPHAKLSFWRDGEMVDRSIGLPTLSSKDWVDIDFGISEGVDFIAVSYVKNANDIKILKNHLSLRAAESIKVLAKIEHSESLNNLGEIVEASDGIMVARGDLGVQIPLDQIPAIQEQITSVCRTMNKPVVIASQLLESMIEYPTPTRAEVADVTEAVKQKADGLMLSGESAVGSYPEKALSVLNTTSTCIEAWARQDDATPSFPQLPRLALSLSDCIAEQICNSAVEMGNNLNVAAILVFTQSGQMASLLSRNRPRPPIFAFTNAPSTAMGLSLYWGVFPIVSSSDTKADDMDARVKESIRFMTSISAVRTGDVVLVISEPASHFVQSIQVRTVS